MAELAISIAVNIGLGVLLLALLYRKRADDRVRLTGQEDAMRVFRLYFPDARGAATVSSDGRGALIELHGVHGRFGLLERRGHRWNARVLAGAEVSSLRFRAPETLQIGIADFGWPRAQLRMSGADRARWMAWLGANGAVAPAGPPEGAPRA
jgi:hypothetical protein